MTAPEHVRGEVVHVPYQPVQVGQPADFGGTRPWAEPPGRAWTTTLAAMALAVWSSLATMALVAARTLAWLLDIRTVQAWAAAKANVDHERARQLARRWFWRASRRWFTLAVLLVMTCVATWIAYLDVWPLLVLFVLAWTTGAASSGVRRPGPRPGPAIQVRDPGAAMWAAPIQPVPAPLEPVAQAFLAAGIGTRTSPVQVEGQPVSDRDGWTVTVDLGPGRTVDQVMARHAQLASALDVRPGQLHLDDLDQRRVQVHVDRTDQAIQVVRSGLATSGQRSIWRPVPIGRTARGQVVQVSLVREGLLVGGRPQHGKTTTARLLVMAAILDPCVDVWCIDGKGGIDWSAVAPVARRYVRGSDSEAAQAAVQVLDEVWAETQRTFAAMDSERHLFPAGRITPEATRAGHRLHLVIVDEPQVFRDADPEAGVAMLSRLAHLARLGPAAGVILLIATQRPDDKALPTQLTAHLGPRICLAVRTEGTGRTVLADEQGAKMATTITRRGVAVVIGAEGTDDVPTMTRIDDSSLDDLRRVAERGAELRLEAGVAMAPPSDEQTYEGGGVAPTIDLLAEVEDVFRPGERWLATSDIALRLDGDTLELGKALSRLGVPMRKMQGGRIRARMLADVKAARAAAGE